MTANLVGGACAAVALIAIVVFAHHERKPVVAPAPVTVTAKPPVVKPPILVNKNTPIQCTKLGDVPEANVAAYAKQYGIPAATVRKLKVCEQ